MNMERLAASYRLEYEVKAKDYVRGGEVSSALRAVLKQLSLPPELVRRCCVACYEAEMNIIIHSFGGRLRVDIYPDRLIMVAEDNVPGIEDLEKANHDQPVRVYVHPQASTKGVYDDVHLCLIASHTAAPNQLWWQRKLF